MRSGRLPERFEPNSWTLRLKQSRAAGEEILDLTETNPTRVGLSDLREARDALSEVEIEPYEPNPRGLETARAALARHYENAPGSDDIVLTTGTSESYAHLFRLLTDPGDAVLVPTPGYPLCEPIAQLEGVTIVPYRLAYDRAWNLDLDSLDDALSRHANLRAMVIVQPNHPTASAFGPDEIAAIEQRCETHSLALISDEVFMESPWTRRGATGRALEPLISLRGPRRVPTFVLGGLSKLCGFPQLKLAWVLAGGPEPERKRLLEGLEWIADTFLSVATPVQLALPRLLQSRGPFLIAMRERLVKNLATLESLLERHPEVTLLEGQAGWAAILRVPAVRSGEEWALALLERGVAVHPGHFYDLEGEACLVLSLIPQPDVFRTAIERLGDALTIL